MPDRPARVLLLSQALTQGGSERQLTATATSLDRSRFETHVAVMRSAGAGNHRADELRRAETPLTEFPMRSFKTDWARQTIRLLKFLRRNRFDIVHSFDLPSNLFATAPARAAGVPVVLASQRSHRDLAPSWGRLAMRCCDRLCHGIVVNCDFLLDHMVKDEGAPRGKIHLCRNGLDTGRFHPLAPRQALPFPEGSVVIGTICALRPEKNLPLLMEAFAELAPHRPEIHLLVVGSGPVQPELERRIAEHGLGRRAHLQPSVADTAPWFRSIDIFVLPSRSEGLSNSVMEAMACGAVPVVSAAGGNPELVKEGRGLMFESGHRRQLVECLRRLLDDVPLREAISARASHWVASSLSLSEMAGTMARIYENLLASRQAARGSG